MIFTSRMGLKELEHDRPELYRELVESGELEQTLVDPDTPLFSRAARAFGAPIVGCTLTALIVYAMLFAYR